MTNQLLNFYNATGINRFVDSVKGFSGGDSEIPFADILIISRVLFAVVMIGFIGYFFDRTKQSLFAITSNEKLKNSRTR